MGSPEVESVLAHLPSIKEPGRSFVVRWVDDERDDGSFVMPYPDYTDDVRQLFDALGDLLSSWGGVDADYMRVSTLARSPDAIAVATPIELRAMLTYLVRGERFCDGFQEGLLEAGYVALMLDRLKELYEHGDLTHHPNQPT